MCHFKFQGTMRVAKPHWWPNYSVMRTQRKVPAWNMLTSTSGMNTEMVSVSSPDIYSTVMNTEMVSVSSPNIYSTVGEDFNI